MSLALAKEQIEQVRTCWSNTQANNRYHKDDFNSRLFSNLLISNPSLKSTLSNDSIIREHAALFGDLFNYAVLYLGNVRRLDSFLQEFFSENIALVNVGTDYLEPLGSSLMQTFRQWLGKGKFDEQLEITWIQIYIHIANNWLLYCGNDATDEEEVEDAESTGVESVNSESRPYISSESEIEDHEDQKEVLVEEERPTDPTRNLPLLDVGASLKINLQSNEKYRGFRRSVKENTTEVSVQIPRNSAFEKLKPTTSMATASTGMSSRLMNKIDKADFDPRLSKKLSKTSTASLRSFQSSEADAKSSTFETKSFSTSRSTSPELESPVSPVEKFGNKKPRIVYDSDEEMEHETKLFGFDPRKKKSVKYSSEEEEEIESDDYDAVKPLFTKSTHTRVNSAFSENFVSDVEDTLELISKPDSPEPRQEVEEYKQRISHFDANSFGIRGLAPIAETALDESSSSIYNSDNNTSSEIISEGRSVEGSTSGVSTLSLHNSDYSEGTEVPSSPNGLQKDPVRQSSQTSEISYMKPLGAGTRLKTSLSLCSLPLDSNAPRASLGFMRSSFILKQEMKTLGYNLPENVSARTSAKPTMEAASLKTSLENSSSSEDFASYAYADSFMPITHRYLDRKMSASCTNLGASRSASSQPNLLAVKPKKAKKQARNNKYDPMEATATTASIRRSNYETGQLKLRRSFKDKMRSFFSSTPKPGSKTISSPLETTYSSNTALTARRSSISTSRTGSSKVPSLMAPPSMATTTGNRRQSSIADIKSMTTVESSDSTSGFSFFSKRKESIGQQSINSRYTTRGDRTKKDKYKVTAVPYNVFAR